MPNGGTFQGLGGTVQPGIGRGLAQVFQPAGAPVAESVAAAEKAKAQAKAAKRKKALEGFDVDASKAFFSTVPLIGNVSQQHRKEAEKIYSESLDDPEALMKLQDKQKDIENFAIMMTQVKDMYNSALDLDEKKAGRIYNREVLQELADPNKINELYKSFDGDLNRLTNYITDSLSRVQSFPEQIDFSKRVSNTGIKLAEELAEQGEGFYVDTYTKKKIRYRAETLSLEDAEGLIDMMLLEDPKAHASLSHSLWESLNRSENPQAEASKFGIENYTGDVSDIPGEAVNEYAKKTYGPILERNIRTNFKVIGRHAEGRGVKEQDAARLKELINGVQKGDQKSLGFLGGLRYKGGTIDDIIYDTSGEEGKLRITTVNTKGQEQDHVLELGGAEGGFGEIFNIFRSNPRFSHVNFEDLQSIPAPKEGEVQQQIDFDILNKDIDNLQKKTGDYSDLLSKINKGKREALKLKYENGKITRQGKDVSDYDSLKELILEVNREKYITTETKSITAGFY